MGPNFISSNHRKWCSSSVEHRRHSRVRWYGQQRELVRVLSPQFTLRIPTEPLLPLEAGILLSNTSRTSTARISVRNLPRFATATSRTRVSTAVYFSSTRLAIHFALSTSLSWRSLARLWMSSQSLPKPTVLPWRNGSFSSRGCIHIFLLK